MCELTFNDEKHLYALDGQFIPSVSMIIRQGGLGADFSAIPAQVMERARNLGTAVHSACELFDRQDLDFDALDPNIKPYLSAWQDFNEQNDFQVVGEHIERAIYSKRHWFAGRPDRIGVINEKATIIDIKTSKKVYVQNYLQLAAYHLAYEELYKPDYDVLCAVVLLCPDGKYKISYVEDLLDAREAFKGAIQVRKFKNKWRKEYARN